MMGAPENSNTQKIFFKKIFVSLLPIATLVLLAIAIFMAKPDIEVIERSAETIPVVSFTISFCFLLTGIFIAALRLWFIADDVAKPIHFRDALLALSLGQIVGAISVQFFGQIAGRAHLLKRRGIGNSANIVMATYERVAALLVSGTMAAFGALYLFGRLSFDLKNGGAEFLTIVAGLLIVISIGAVGVWGEFAAPFLKAFVRSGALKRMARSVLLSAAIQLCTAGSYFSLAKSLAPNISQYPLIAAILVVMFAASLPISFSGWGMRELSAVFAFNTIGVESSISFTIAILIGFMALISVVFVAGIAALWSPNVSSDEQASAPSEKIDNISNYLKWALPISVATAVFFQIHVPTLRTELSVNLADPIAIVCAILFVPIAAKVKWRIKHLPLAMAAMSAAIILSYLVGYVYFGSNHWATINRLVGWGLLLSYGMAGALIASHAGHRGVDFIARTVTLTACAIIAFFILLIAVNNLGLRLPIDILPRPLSGFSQNRNAFSFALLMTLSILPLIANNQRPIILAIISLGLFVAGSHAALGDFVLLCGVLLTLRIMTAMQIVASLIGPAACFLALDYLSTIGSLGYDVAVVTTDHASSNAERLASIEGGISLFISHPIFGAGLGAYLNGQSATSDPLVIHSTPIWLLGETGLVGFAAFVIPASVLFLRNWRSRQSSNISQAIVLVLIAFAVMSSVHELLYQRIMWLLLGMLLVQFSSPSYRDAS